MFHLIHKGLKNLTKKIENTINTITLYFENNICTYKENENI